MRLGTTVLLSTAVVAALPAACGTDGGGDPTSAPGGAVCPVNASARPTIARSSGLVGPQSPGQRVRWAHNRPVSGLGGHHNCPVSGLGGAGDGEDLGLAEQRARDLADVVEGDRVDPVDHLVEGEQLVVDQLRLPDP